MKEKAMVEIMRESVDYLKTVTRANCDRCMRNSTNTEKCSTCEEGPAYKLAIDALERRIPAPVSEHGECPYCGSYANKSYHGKYLGWLKSSYCRACGKALIWPKEEG